MLNDFTFLKTFLYFLRLQASLFKNKGNQSDVLADKVNPNESNVSYSETVSEKKNIKKLPCFCFLFYMKLFLMIKLFINCF